MSERGYPVAVRDFTSWRAAARRLLAAGVPPDVVRWREADGEPDLFGGGAEDDFGDIPMTSSGIDAIRLPRDAFSLLTAAACHRSPDRWAFLYRVLWRWRRGERDVLSAADPDGARLHAMARAVERETHKLHAYLRFRERPLDAGAPRFVAWFEPEHDVLERAAPHFAHRMGAATWMIGTPRASMLWDGATLYAGPPGMRGPADVDDAGEALWLIYYRSTFNPARLNPKTMQRHIPLRYWKNLPEGRLVPAMIAEAAAGASRIAQTPSVGARGGAAIPVDAERAQPYRLPLSALDACRRCELWRDATQAVPGAGPRDARIMLVGEQPGDREDLAGTPFIGPAGALLDDALAQAGLSRETLYVTNAVKHFKWTPQGKHRLHRTPGRREIDACGDWLRQELAQVAPDVVVALGGTALKALLGGHRATPAALGQPFLHDGRRLIALRHPAFILRLPDPAARTEAFAQLVAGLRRAALTAGTAVRPETGPGDRARPFCQRSPTMPQSLVWVYDNYESANAARNALLDAGFAEDRIQFDARYEGAGPMSGNFYLPPEGNEPPSERKHGFFHSLTHDADNYTESYAHTSQQTETGTLLVTVDPENDTQRAQAAEIMTRCGGTNIEKRTP